MSLQVTTCVEKNQRNLSSGEPWELKKATGYDANLQREILARSHAQTWAAAKLEWHFYNAYFDGTGGIVYAGTNFRALRAAKQCHFRIRNSRQLLCQEVLGAFE